jgi:hypothetical protein
MHNKDIESWGGLWNENASILIPYPTKDFPNKITGLSSQILPGFKDLFSKFTHMITHKRSLPHN